MKKICILTIAFLWLSIVCSAQSFSEFIRIITPLENGTYDIKVFTSDSVILYKGTLSEINPDKKHGRFYFFDSIGNIKVFGLYYEDLMIGKWNYYNSDGSLWKCLDYDVVWDYFRNDTVEFKADKAAIRSLKRNDKLTMNDDGVFSHVEKMPVFKVDGKTIDFEPYIQERIQLPIYSELTGRRGSVEIECIIDSEGKIRMPRFTMVNNPEFNMEIQRLLYSEGTWEPGMQSGVQVDVHMRFSFNFINPIIEEGFYIVDEMPVFDGGDPAFTFRKYIAANLYYPEEASSNRKEGRVIVQFAVLPDGSVDDVVVLHGVHPSLDKEAIRVVRSSPKWQPGKMEGREVKVIFTFPINFVLQ